MRKHDDMSAYVYNLALGFAWGQLSSRAGVYSGMDRAFIALLYIISIYPDSHGTVFRFFGKDAGVIQCGVIVRCEILLLWTVG